MRNRKLVIGLVAMFTCGLATPALVAEEDQVHRMYEMTIKSGQEAAFYAKLAEHSAWRRENGDPWTWWVYQVVNGPRHGNCIIRSGPVSWAGLDAYEAFDVKGSEAFWATVGEHIEDAKSWITMIDDRFTRWHPEMDDVQLISVITYDLKPGMQKQFTDSIQTYHDTIVENDYPTYYLFDWTLNGGHGSQITLALFFKNWADMQAPEEQLQAFMSRVLGEEEAGKLIKDFTSSFSSSESSIVRYMPELSILHPEEK